MIARALILALGTAVFVAVISIGGGSNPASPPTSFATTSVAWADLDCSGDITTADPLQALSEIGGLPGDTAEFCPILGTPAEVDGVDRVIGDVNCDGLANARDAVELIADLAGIGATTGDCPDVGAAVDLTELATIVEVGEDWRDYGDAPDGAPTLYTGGAVTGSFPTSAALGPSHETPFAFRLGEFETAEEAPREDDSADDGLLWLEMNECDTSSALLAISLDGLSEIERDTPLTVNIFADWNKDGDWDDTDGCSDEWALQNFALDVSGEPDFTVLTVDFPGGDQVGEFWMRVMLTDEDYNPATDNLLPGETEDYLISGGQVFLPEGSARTSGLAQPLGGKKAGNEFLCRGSVVPHGKKDVVFDFEQTTASFDSGFRVRRIQTSIDQPTKEDGKKATGVSVARTALVLTKLDKNHQVDNDPTNDGRINLRITVEVTTTVDTPDRIEGPFTVNVSISGRQRDGKKFSGQQDCSFYVDHAAGAPLQDPFIAGFFGGPGRAADQGKTNPKFVFVQHGKTIVLPSDALILNCAGLTGADKTACQQEVTGSRYDKSSVTVFGSDGAVIAPADLKTKAGIKSVKPATNRRVIKIKTVKDDHDPPVERIVIRIKGTRPGGGTFWDYFRVVIIHERGSKAKKLATEFMESSVAFFFEEDEATTIAYVGDGEALISHEAPFGDAIFDDTEVICVAGGEQAVAHPFHSLLDVSSLGFILDYAGGQSSDVFYIPPSNLVSRSVSGDSSCPPPLTVNLTNFGQFSPFFIIEATGCFDKVIFSELNTESGEFQLGAVAFDGSGLGPVPGGENYRDPSCFRYDSQMGIVGSTPGDGGSSEGGYVPLEICNATCTESLLASKVIIPADGSNVHVLGLAVSPDAMKIAWYRSTPSDSQVWVGDFDPLTQTVSNHQQLTTEGLNYDPTWSPDGSQLAFLSDRDGNFEIYVMNADGSDQTNITNTPSTEETEPSWQVP